MMRVALRLLTVIMLAAFVSTSMPMSMPRASADPIQPSGRDDYLPVIVVLDTSGSMGEASGPNKTKIEGARASVVDLVNSLSPNTPFGLIAYPGHNARVVDGCSEGNEEVPLGPLDQSAAAAAVRRLNPDGNTPTGPALTHAARIIKSSPTQQGTIVLVSDGESNCGSPGVCEVAKKLSAEGVEITVNTVGLQISPAGAQELQCIASTTGGRYADANNPADLKAALQDLGGARLNLDGAVPTTMAAVSGTGPGGSKVVFTVTNSGRIDAQDVRVSLDFRDRNNLPGAVLVPRPVRFLGNIGPGQNRSVEFVIRPDSARLEQFTWIAAATANNAAPSVKSGKSSVVEPFGNVTGLLAGKQDIAIVGDSYSSGEGTHNYMSGTDDNKHGNLCHRSPDAYGPRLSQSATIIACSNATTGDFYTSQKSGLGVPPQLQTLRAMVTAGNAPDAVLLSIGGNDALFAKVVFNCSITPACHTDIVLKDWQIRTYETVITDLVVSLANDLRQVYRDVHRAVNDQKARDSRDGQVAPIVVLPYPRILPENGSGKARDGCALGISADELKFLNRYLDALNLQIEAAVGVLRSKDTPIYFAKDVIKAFQPDHTICDGNKSYANFISLRGGGSTPADPIHENLHPNAAGYAAMARAISAWSASQVAVQNPELPAWSERVIRDSDGSVLAPSVGPVTPSGGITRVTTGGYAPGSNVILRMYSTPHVLGSATADDNGNIDVAVPIPTDTPLGSHQVVAIGFDANGALHEQTKTIWVVPRYALEAVILLVIGVGAVAFGLAGMVVSRRRR